MKSIIKPPVLRRGDVIGICAPASAPDSRQDLESGVRYLERNGFRVKLGKNVFRRRGYLAGSDVQRASDLNEFFSDRAVHAIFTVRGGYGSNRLLTLLDYASGKPLPPKRKKTWRELKTLLRGQLRPKKGHSRQVLEWQAPRRKWEESVNVAAQDYELSVYLSS